jgi:hypothetical protein
MRGVNENNEMKMTEAQFCRALRNIEGPGFYSGQDEGSLKDVISEEG